MSLTGREVSGISVEYGEVVANSPATPATLTLTELEIGLMLSLLAIAESLPITLDYRYASAATIDEVEAIIASITEKITP